MEPIDYFTADTHFEHGNVIAYCDRPFANLEAMRRTLVERWNATVRQCDRVLHLGDFALGDRTRIPALLAALNGELTLVTGNHDFARDDKYFKHVLRGRSFGFQSGGTLLEVAHNPLHLTGTVSPIGLCGHVHTAWRGQSGQPDGFRVFNVGVDVRGFRPVSLTELLADDTLHAQGWALED